MNSNLTSSKAKRLLWSHNIFISARVFFEIYLNVYIWKQTEDLNLIILFNLFYVVFQIVGFHGLAYLVKRGKINSSRIISLLGFTAVYLIIFFLGEGAINYLFYIGAFAGFFNGVYRISYQVLRFDLTNALNRGNYAGLENASKIIVDIVMPILGGFIIVGNFFNAGYSLLFLLGVLFFAVSFFVGLMKLPLGDRGEFHFWKTWKLVKSDSDMMKSMWSYFFSNFSRGGTIVKLLLPLLMFEVINNELELGAWLSFFSVSAIVISYLFGKFVHYKKYGNMLLIGGFLYFALLLLLIFFPYFWIFILFGALVKIVDIFIKIPKRVISENLINTMDDPVSHRIENIVIREWFNIVLGRGLGLIALLYVSELDITKMKFFLLLVAFGTLFEVFVLRSIRKSI